MTIYLIFKHGDSPPVRYCDNYFAQNLLWIKPFLNNFRAKVKESIVYKKKSVRVLGEIRYHNSLSLLVLIIDKFAMF